ncbi:MAG: DsbA family oxidoreductase [Dechloromonas sp.]|nr:DsbA family oxidoreductase [Dechloromonas sp.]
MSEKLDVTFHFDLICPWCLIGKRHLDTAIDLFRQRHPDVDIAIDWQSHILLPDTPEHGIPYQAFYEQRLGGKAAVAARRAQVQEAARAAGIKIAFESIEFMPNTQAAHHLIDCAMECCSAEQVDDLIDRLFTAYFLDGRNIGDPGELTAIAASAGCPTPGIAACLDSIQHQTRFSERLAATGNSQVSGVPFFVFNERLAISGAHPPQSLLAAMEKALMAAPVTQPS